MPYFDITFHDKDAGTVERIRAEGMNAAECIAMHIPPGTRHADITLDALPDNPELDIEAPEKEPPTETEINEMEKQP
mgnify:CR=1 FL=1